jgi:hypothetical protein
LRVVAIWLTLVLKFFSMSWSRFISFPVLFMTVSIKGCQQRSGWKLWLRYGLAYHNRLSMVSLKYGFQQGQDGKLQLTHSLAYHTYLPIPSIYQWILVHLILVKICWKLNIWKNSPVYVQNTMHY